jgi:polyisoprenoid-binding protein YceI
MRTPVHVGDRGNEHVTARFTFDSTRSYLRVSGRSSRHPIDTETRGITGWFEASQSADGLLELADPVAGELQLAVDGLTSGNHLYDRELRRRINARRYPTIGARLVGVAPSPANGTYLVTGDVTFHGRTQTFEHNMTIRFGDDHVTLSGEDVFDIRQFGMEPPSMLMIRVYPEISVRLELFGVREGS